MKGVAAGDGSRDRVPLPDQSRARGKGTSIEMITTGKETMRQNETVIRSSNHDDWPCQEGGGGTFVGGAPGQ